MRRAHCGQLAQTGDKWIMYEEITKEMKVTAKKLSWANVVHAGSQEALVAGMKHTEN
jgi:hypothetical protein